MAIRFGTAHFINTLEGLIKSKHRQFIADGLTISLNGRHIDASNVFLSFRDSLQPGYQEFKVKESGLADVLIRITVGVGSSNPREAGWYIICNGRVVLEADRTNVTGWGVIESKQYSVPTYHNQFARFRGIASFDSTDSARVPWNTTKDGIDQDSPVWQRAFSKMIEAMRPVIDFLNELDRDLEDLPRDKSALFQFVDKAPRAASETFTSSRSFSAPRREDFQSGIREVKIQYYKPIDQIELLEEALGLSSAKAVGEKTFELILKRNK